MKQDKMQRIETITLYISIYTSADTGRSKIVGFVTEVPGMVIILTYFKEYLKECGKDELIFTALTKGLDKCKRFQPDKVRCYCDRNFDLEKHERLQADLKRREQPFRHVIYKFGQRDEGLLSWAIAMAELNEKYSLPPVTHHENTPY